MDQLDNGAAQAHPTNSGTHRSVGEHTRQLDHDTSALLDELGSTVRDVQAYVGDQLRRQPWRTLGVATGVGYVLGGGLDVRMLRLLTGIALRLATAVAVRELGERILPHDSAPNAKRTI